MRGGWVVLLGFSSGCVVGGGEVSYEFLDASSLTVSLSNGSVTAEGSEDSSTHVAWDGGGFGKAAVPDVTDEAGGVVTVDASHQFGGGDLIANLPPGVDLTVLLDRGDVTVDLPHPANLDLCVAAGSVSVTVPAGDYDLDLDLGVGSVEVGLEDVDGAPYSISICGGAGDISVEAR